MTIKWLFVAVVLLGAEVTAETPAAVRRGPPVFTDPGIVVRPVTNNPDGGVTLSEQTVWESPESHCARTGYYRGKACVLWALRGRRTLGWNAITDFEEVAQHLNTTQSNSLDTSTATPYYLHSTSTADVDIDGGSGARTVRIFYLLDGGVPMTAIHPLNGTTAVSIGSGYAAFEWMTVTNLGSANTTGAPIGDITIDTSAAGVPTVAQTIDIIPIGHGRSAKGRFVVPSTHTCYGVDLNGSATGGATQDVQLRANLDPYDRTIQDSVLIEQYPAFLTSGTAIDEELHWLKFPALSTLRIVSKSSVVGAANRLDVIVHLLCVAN